MVVTLQWSVLGALVTIIYLEFYGNRNHHMLERIMWEGQVCQLPFVKIPFNPFQIEKFISDGIRCKFKPARAFFPCGCAFTLFAHMQREKRDVAVRKNTKDTIPGSELFWANVRQ